MQYQIQSHPYWRRALVERNETARGPVYGTLILNKN